MLEHKDYRHVVQHENWREQVDPGWKLVRVSGSGMKMSGSGLKMNGNDSYAIYVLHLFFRYI